MPMRIERQFLFQLPTLQDILRLPPGDFFKDIRAAPLVQPLHDERTLPERVPEHECQCPFRIIISRHMMTLPQPEQYVNMNVQPILANDEYRGYPTPV